MTGRGEGEERDVGGSNGRKDMGGGGGGVKRRRESERRSG